VQVREPRLSLLAYSVDAPRQLARLHATIDRLMESAIDLGGRRWIGMDPDRPPGEGELALYVVDGARMSSDGCAAPLSTACRIGSLVADSCAAIDDRTIACDAHFQATVQNIALFVANPAGMAWSETPRDEPWQRSDVFFAATYRKDLREQLDRLVELDRALASHGGADAAVRFDAALAGALDFILTHELGHIELGHVSAGPRSTDEALNAGLREDEAAADRFAILQLVRRSDAQRLGASLGVVGALDSYRIKRITLEAGVSRLTGTELVQEIANVAPPYIEATCSDGHTSFSSRLVRIFAMPELAAVVENAPEGSLDGVKTFAGYGERICAGFEKLIEENDSIDAPPSEISALDIEIIDAGSPPLQTLRYRWTPGTVHRRRHSRKDMVHPSAERARPSMASGHATVLDIEVVGIANGVGMVKVELVGSSFHGLKGKLAAVMRWFDDRGRLAEGHSKVTVKATPDSPWTAATIDDAKLFGGAWDLWLGPVPLPEAPVGVGGSWLVRRSIVDAESSFSGETTYRLISRVGDHLVVEATQTTSWSTAEDAAQATGKVRSEVDLDEPGPVALDGSYTLAVRDGDRFEGRQTIMISIESLPR
jgi:hypothetical protein